MRAVADARHLHEDLQRVQVERDGPRAVALQGEQGHVVHQPRPIDVLGDIGDVLRGGARDVRLVPLLPDSILFEPLLELTDTREILFESRTVLGVEPAGKPPRLVVHEVEGAHAVADLTHSLCALCGGVGREEAAVERGRTEFRRDEHAVA